MLFSLLYHWFVLTGLKSLQSLSCGLRLSAKKLKRSGRKSVDVGNAESVLTVPEVLKIAKEVVNEDFVGMCILLHSQY